MSRTLEIEHINANCVEFRGFNVRELHEETAGRPPVWNTRTRRWVTSPRRVEDLVALAETRGYDVRVAGRPAIGSSSSQPEQRLGPIRSEQPDPGAGLW